MFIGRRQRCPTGSPDLRSNELAAARWVLSVPSLRSTRALCPTGSPFVLPAADYALAPTAGLLLPSAVRSTPSRLGELVSPPRRATSPPSRPSAAPSALPDFRQRPFPRAASQLAAIQSA